MPHTIVQRVNDPATTIQKCNLRRGLNSIRDLSQRRQISPDQRTIIIFTFNFSKHLKVSLRTSATTFSDCFISWCKELFFFLVLSHTCTRPQQTIERDFFFLTFMAVKGCVRWDLRNKTKIIIKVWMIIFFVSLKTIFIFLRRFVCLMNKNNCCGLCVGAE